MLNPQRTVSHILQSIYCERFMSLVDSFGVIY